MVSEIVFEPSQQGTADAESVELLEQQFVVNPVEGFNGVKIDLHRPALACPAFRLCYEGLEVTGSF